MKVRKNISLEESIYLKGKEKADKMFGGNFSVYLTNLIARDCSDIEVKNEISEPVESKEKSEEKIYSSEAQKIKDIKLDEESKNSLDEIL